MGIIFLMVIILYNTKSQDVFNIISVPQPITKGESNPIVSFACNLVWGLVYPQMLISEKKE